MLTFAEAIKDADNSSKRHLLLGNGFSIACRPDIFHYGSLFSRADFSKNPKLVQVFEVLGTQDFEIAIRHLEAGAKLLPIYAGAGASAAQAMMEDAAALKEILVSTIAANHPNVPSDIPNSQFWACRNFLRNFLNADGQIFTLNYDLLLYWALMHDDNPFDDQSPMLTNDGFGNDEDDPNADYVVWQGEVGAHSAKVHFLHGALHLYDAGNELQKYTWARTNDRLVDQARNAISNDKFPLFIAEGESAKKKGKIRHNAYLYQGYKQLTANAAQQRHCFFLHGHSLAANDDHILRRLATGKFSKLYVSLHGDQRSEGNVEIMKRANALMEFRNRKYPLQVEFYDAASAMVWG